MLVQIRVGLVFPLLAVIALMARKTDLELHKRLMFLSITPALPAAFDRMQWLPTTLPESALAPDLYIVASVMPLLIWDVIRSRKIHMAFWIWLVAMASSSTAIHLLWGTEWWQQFAPGLMGL